jgi:hypothetical protein
MGMHAAEQAPVALAFTMLSLSRTIATAAIRSPGDG